MKRNDSEILSQVFKAQLHDPISGDWTESIKRDLLDFNLNHLSFKAIKSLKKKKFKTLVKKACQKAAFESLSNEKETKTKLDNCEYKDFKIQNYLRNKNLISRKQKLLFKFRTRMINVGNNYGKNNLCPLGCIALDTQEHIFECKELVDSTKVSKDFNYSDIFSNNPIKFIYATNLADELLRKKEQKLSLQI